MIHLQYMVNVINNPSMQLWIKKFKNNITTILLLLIIFNFVYMFSKLFAFVVLKKEESQLIRQIHILF